MRFGVYAPTSNDYDVKALMSLAVDAERAGWDGFFIWDNLLATFDGTGVLADTTVALAAIALSTTRLRFGAIVTALPRRRPWKFAKEMATLDNLSGGRLIAGVGLGGKWDFLPVGEFNPEIDRGRVLDEALAVVTALWTGEPTSHAGRHFNLQDAKLVPPPIQQPRIPIWVAGSWPGASAPFRRAARWDGVAPVRRGELFAGLMPDELRACVKLVQRHRTSTMPLDVVHFQTGKQPRWALVDRYAAAGATWWLESTFPLHETIEEFRRRVVAGPPR